MACDIRSSASITGTYCPDCDIVHVARGVSMAQYSAVCRDAERIKRDALAALPAATVAHYQRVHARQAELDALADAAGSIDPASTVSTAIRRRRTLGRFLTTSISGSGRGPFAGDLR
jgi:hypothetical protein